MWGFRPNPETSPSLGPRWMRLAGPFVRPREGGIDLPKEPRGQNMWRRFGFRVQGLGFRAWGFRV